MCDFRGAHVRLAFSPGPLRVLRSHLKRNYGNFCIPVDLGSP